MADRRAILLVTPELCTEMVKGVQEPGDRFRRFRVVENPIPSDAKVVDVYYDAGQGLFNIVLESSAFDLVEEGKPLPIVKPMMQTIYEDETAEEG